MAIGIVQKASSVLPAECRSEAPIGFTELVIELKDALGPSSGLTSDDVDVNHLTWLMDGYDAREQGWLPFAMKDASRGYTRNLVDEGNGKSNLVRTTLDAPHFSISTDPWMLTSSLAPSSLSSFGRLAKAARFTTTATHTA